MMLFVFEGKFDSSLFDTFKALFFPDKSDTIFCTYNSNIYTLYRKLKEYDLFGSFHAGDTIAVLKDVLPEQEAAKLTGKDSSSFSEIYLFFDYDFQESSSTLDENNMRIRQMLEYFDDETGSGKLYIHYPMVESLRYTKKLPDENYCGYTVTRDECRCFKDLTQRFSFYSSYDHIQFPERISAERKQARLSGIQRNWEHLIRMNVRKAYFLCCGSESYPEDKTLVAQGRIFENQLCKYVERNPCRVSVLNSFPLFLYEYFPWETFSKEK